MSHHIQKNLRNLQNRVGNYTVAMNNLERIPPWISWKERDEEHENNWSKVYYEVDK